MSKEAKEVVVNPIANLTSSCLRYTDGSINVEATLSLYKYQLEKQADKECDQKWSFTNAIENVFDNNRGKLLPKSFIVSSAVQTLTTDPKEYAELMVELGQFLTDSPKYDVTKRRGVIRLSDCLGED